MAKTFELLVKGYYWPTMRNDMEQYIKNCHTCQRTKPIHHAPFGTLKPLPIPYHPWEELSMDFVTGLLNSVGFDTILVVVAHLTKMRHLIPCHKTSTASDMANMFLTHV